MALVTRFLLLSYLVLPVGPQALESATEAVIPKQRIELFDGRTLEPFYTWLVDEHRQDPNRVFSVVDQVDGAPALRISGQQWGGIVTRQAFRDFHLVVEFRWGLITWGDRRSAARDSGVLIHCQGPDGNTGEDSNGPWMRSIEAQIIEGGVGDFILVAGHDAAGRRQVPEMTSRVRPDRDGELVFDPKGESHRFQGGRINWFGRDVDWVDQLSFRGRQDVESRYGQWTRLEVIADGATVTNIVNGVVVNRGWNASLHQGRIMIQSEGAEIYFRRIELHPLAGDRP